MIRFIAALDEMRGIADAHGIPWQGKVPSDVAQFRAKTLHGVVMMGFGWYQEQEKPLPERRNLVATSSPDSLRAGFEKVIDARKFLSETTEDIWVGGGAALFASTLDLADELYLTHLEGNFDCTKFFPEYEDQFTLASKSAPVVENDIAYYFATYTRKPTNL